MEVKRPFIWKTGVQEFEAFDGEKPAWTFTNISGIAQATKTYLYVTNLKKNGGSGSALRLSTTWQYNYNLLTHLFSMHPFSNP